MRGPRKGNTTVFNADTTSKRVYRYAAMGYIEALKRATEGASFLVRDTGEDLGRFENNIKMASATAIQKR